MSTKDQSEKGIWPKWVPVEGGDDLKQAAKHGLKIRRIGSDLEGSVLKVGGVAGHRKVTILYPDHGNCEEGFKKGSIHIITDLEKYELEPSFLMQRFLWELVIIMESGEFGIPRCQEDRLDIDVLGIFLANNGPEIYLRNRQRCEQTDESNLNKKKMLLVNKFIGDYLLRFKNITWLWEEEDLKRESSSNSISEIRELNLYFIEVCLRILFWYCYENINMYSYFNSAQAAKEEQKRTNRSVARLIDNIDLPWVVRIRAARVVNALKNTSSRLPAYFNHAAESTIKEIVTKGELSSQFRMEHKKLIQLAQYDLSGEVGKKPKYFF
jgi:hypothetical protein